MKKGLLAMLLLGGMALGATAVLLLQSGRLASPVLAEAAHNEQRQMVIAVDQVVNGERLSGEVQVAFAAAPELPQRDADLFGLYVQHDADGMTVGTGGISVAVDAEATNDEEPITTISADYDGDEVEVAFTADTQFYLDTTPRPDITAADIEAGEMTLTRTVTAGAAAGLGENMTVRVWGHEENGRFIADVVAYEPIH